MLRTSAETMSDENDRVLSTRRPANSRVRTTADWSEWPWVRTPNRDQLFWQQHEDFLNTFGDLPDIPFPSDIDVIGDRSFSSRSGLWADVFLEGGRDSGIGPQEENFGEEISGIGIGRSTNVGLPGGFDNTGMQSGLDRGARGIWGAKWDQDINVGRNANMGNFGARSGPATSRWGSLWDPSGLKGFGINPGTGLGMPVMGGFGYGDGGIIGIRRGTNVGLPLGINVGFSDWFSIGK
ncbi:unnamed protein product [Toxocara canis]|uniref:Uncharacterized protein n=1 Tax=Toxocara canis TaxID=6265 RepID=A0A3P7GWG4_TOXCA|nr:unnamed protein product [Toxocara canis]